MITKKNIKPIDLDVHLKYRCPKSSCDSYHWLSLSEAKTKNFKVVCDCGHIFKPKPIERLRVIYKKSFKPIKHICEPKDIETKQPPDSVVDTCSKVLIGYGFSKNESIDIINDTYKKYPIDDSKILIKHIIENIGVSNGQN